MNDQGQGSRTFYETKVQAYCIATILLILLLNPFGFESYLFLVPIVMLVSVFLRPVARITISEANFIYEKGRKRIVVPWNEVEGVHQDSVFSPNLISFYISSKFRMGGFFVETKSQGFTDYIGPMSENRYGFSSHSIVDVTNEISKRCHREIRTGAVSILKQRKKLWDVSFIILAVFTIPVLVILLWGVFTGSIGESMSILKDLFLLLTGQV